MQKIKFWKMSGAGNDFVLITGGRKGAAELGRLAAKLCRRGSSVGADGLLYVNRAGRGRVRVRYFNSDGSEAFCGNGSRCAALWAWSRGLAGRAFTLETFAGSLEVRVASGKSVEMRMPDVPAVRLNMKGAFPAGILAVHFLDTGVPHAVIPVKSVARLDVPSLGASLRRNRAFGPAGANVNFVEVRKGVLHVRTYERGVEGETLACGTGITACAVALALAGSARPPVTALPLSGEKFRIKFSKSGGGAREVYVRGPAEIVFEGETR